jgi:hypothetical protein
VRGEQEATTTRLRLCFFDGVLDLADARFRAGVEVFLGVDHPRQGGRIFGDGRAVEVSGDIGTAVADKDTDP